MTGRMITVPRCTSALHLSGTSFELTFLIFHDHISEESGILISSKLPSMERNFMWWNITGLVYGGLGLPFHPFLKLE